MVKYTDKPENNREKLRWAKFVIMGHCLAGALFLGGCLNEYLNRADAQLHATREIQNRQNRVSEVYQVPEASAEPVQEAKRQTAEQKEEDIEDLEKRVKANPEIDEQENENKKTRGLNSEYLNPKIKGGHFSNDSDTMILARALYGEARREVRKGYGNYVFGVARSIITRADRKGKTLKEIVLAKNPKTIIRNGKEVTIDVYQYTCFNPNDNNFDNILDPVGNGEDDKEILKQVWKKCYDISDHAINGEIDGKPSLKDVTNYFVSCHNPQDIGYKDRKNFNIPYWAYETKNGKKTAREPAEVVELEKGKKAFFYNFKYF